MRLSENQQIVESLNQILEDYDFLKYDEARPRRDRNFDGLHIKVIPPTECNVQVTERSVQTIEDICRRLEETTNRHYFFIYGGNSSAGDNLDEVWTFFTLRESAFSVSSELYRTERQICCEIERLISEQNIDIEMNFEITVSHPLNFKFSGYSDSIASLLSIATETIRNLRLEEKFSTIFYDETTDGFEMQISSSEEELHS